MIEAKHEQIRFHANRLHIITNNNDNKNIDSKIEGLVNGRIQLTTS
jgi:hypothetical protein